MKYLLLILISLPFFGCKDDASKVPTAIKTEFEKRFGATEKVLWEVEEEGYEVEFQKDGVNMSANYDLTGVWAETEATLENNNLPGIVTSNIQKSYPGYEIDKAETISTPSMNGYEVALKKGNTELELVLDKNGGIIKVKDQE